ncbi:MAG: tributyrin esterase [Candidatus Bathyarchaeota archaeon]|nr:MAG: tributyrin esterase [Candidatus Bathyarchaeota archaeon]
MLAVKQEMERISEQEINGEGLDLRTVNQMIKNAIRESGVAVVSHSEYLSGLAAGLRTGNVFIKGGAGDFVGSLNSGAKLTIEGDVQNFLADNMTSGEIIVSGNAGYCAGPYCYGGNLVILGHSGNFSATMNKGATLVVNEDVGDDVGTYMLAGNIVVLGNAGEKLGHFLISGNIFIRGKWQSLGHNTNIDVLTSDDKKFLQQLFSKYRLDARPEEFTKIVAQTDRPFYSKKD